MLSFADQIVVATEHLELVRKDLEAAHVGPTGIEHNPRLGLSLVTLPHDAERLRQAGQKLRQPVPEDQYTVLRKPHDDIDPLLAALRDLYRYRYAGWMPTMGKNRLLHGIELLPYASVVGFDLPEPVNRPDGVVPGRPPVTRDAGPVRRARVGIIDVRLAPHSRLEGSYLADPDGLDLPAANGAVRQGWQGHATFIANLILQEVPTAELVVRTALTGAPDAADPKDRFHMPLWRFAERLVEFEDAGVQVLNCSLGCETVDGRPPLVLDRAVARLSSTMVIVAGAGNHGDPQLTAEQRTDPLIPADPSAALFPAALDGVLAVGARTENGDVAPFNPRGGSAGGWAPWIDGFVRGENVVSAYLGDGAPEEVELPDRGGVHRVWFGGWAKWTGTSFAAARMTAAIAQKIAEGKDPSDALVAACDELNFRSR